jgi:hypothetical protein
MCEILDPYSGAGEDASLLANDGVSIVTTYPMFRKTLLPPFLGFEWLTLFRSILP